MLKYILSEIINEIHKLFLYSGHVTCIVTENDFLSLRVEILYSCPDLVCKKYGPNNKLL